MPMSNSSRSRVSPGGIDSRGLASVTATSPPSLSKVRGNRLSSERCSCEGVNATWSLSQADIAPIVEHAASTAKTAATDRLRATLRMGIPLGEAMARTLRERGECGIRRRHRPCRYRSRQLGKHLAPRLQPGHEQAEQYRGNRAQHELFANQRRGQ